ncbi:MAG: acyl carrier protein [Clostridia bacterium]|nr:acyl carrier protein [Clostridia bacterium]
MEQLIEILEEMKPGVDFNTEDDLIAHGVFDSLGIVMLVAALNDEFDIEITPPDVVPENFKSAETIWALVQRLEDE